MFIRFHRGFTLIEMLAALTLLLLLAALAIPSLQSVVGETRSNTAVLSAQSLAHELDAYAATNQTAPSEVVVADLTADFPAGATVTDNGDGTVTVTQGTGTNQRCATITLANTLGGSSAVAATACTGGNTPVAPQPTGPSWISEYGTPWSGGATGGVVDAAGNLYVIGTSGTTSHLVKYTADGTQTWDMTYKTTGAFASSWITAIKLRANGNILIAGDIWDYTDANNGGADCTYQGLTLTPYDGDVNLYCDAGFVAEIASSTGSIVKFAVLTDSVWSGVFGLIDAGSTIHTLNYFNATDSVAIGSVNFTTHTISAGSTVAGLNQQSLSDAQWERMLYSDSTGFYIGKYASTSEVTFYGLNGQAGTTVTAGGASQFPEIRTGFGRVTVKAGQHLDVYTAGFGQLLWSHDYNGSGLNPIDGNTDFIAGAVPTSATTVAVVGTTNTGGVITGWVEQRTSSGVVANTRLEYTTENSSGDIHLVVTATGDYYLVGTNTDRFPGSAINGAGPNWFIARNPSATATIQP